MAPTRAISGRLLRNRTCRLLTKEILARQVQKGKPVGPLPGPVMSQDRRWASQDRWMRHTIRVAAGLGILVGGCVLAACATTPSPDDLEANSSPTTTSTSTTPTTLPRRHDSDEPAPPHGGRASSCRT